jgi:hypothetical protein
VHVTTIREDAKHYGMSAKTLTRAAGDMEVIKAPPGGGRNCTWDLNETVKEMMGLLDGDETPTPDEPDDDGPTFDDLDAGLTALLGGDDE